MHGSWKDAAKSTLHEASIVNTIRAESSQSQVARGFFEAASVAPWAVGAASVEEANARAFYAQAEAIGRRMRGAQDGPTALGGSAQRFLAELVAGSLPVLSTIDSVCLPGPPEVKAVKLLALLEGTGTRGTKTVARAGWAAPGAAGQRPSWTTSCPLCQEQGVPMPAASGTRKTTSASVPSSATSGE